MKTLNADYSRSQIKYMLSNTDYYVAIPALIRRGLQHYFLDRTPTGSGLRSILENKPIFEVVNRLDPETLAALPLIIKFVWNIVPSPCWGSPERVEQWLDGSTPLPEEWVESAVDRLAKLEE